MASRDANVFDQSGVCTNDNKVSAPFTYYFESFSNIVFVSSSVSGLIVTYFRGVSASPRLLAEKKTWGSAEEVVLVSGSYVTSAAGSVPGFFFWHSFNVLSAVSVTAEAAAIR